MIPDHGGRVPQVGETIFKIVDDADSRRLKPHGFEKTVPVRTGIQTLV